MFYRVYLVFKQPLFHNADKASRCQRKPTYKVAERNRQKSKTIQHTTCALLIYSNYVTFLETVAESYFSIRIRNVIVLLFYN